METEAFQDLVDWHCYGCGRLNDHGLQIKSRWEDDDVVCRWRPQSHHVGLPGWLQGGVLATVITCHALWTATATACRDERVAIEEPMRFAYSTMSLDVDFLEPVPIDRILTLRGRTTSIDRERAAVSCDVFVDEQQTTRARSEHRRVALLE